MRQSAIRAQAGARADFEHILDAIPLVFLDSAEGQAHKDALPAALLKISSLGLMLVSVNQVTREGE